MKIWLVCNSYVPIRGGVQVVVEKLAKTFCEKGHKVTVLTSMAPKGAMESERVNGIAVNRFSFSIYRGTVKSLLIFLLRLVPNICKLIRLFRKERPDVVNLHYVDEHSFYLLILWYLFRFPLITNIHGSDIMKNSVDSRFIRFTLKCLLRKSDYVISNSKYLLVQALSYGPDARSKALVIPNGIDMMGLNPPGSVLEEPVNTPYVISVGRFIAEKGFDILVKAFSIAGAKYPEYTLIIIGDGDEKRNLLCLKDRIGLKNRVLFLGEMKHESVLRYMALSSFVVLPSRQESFGIVLLEAMVCGKAVIGTNVGGIPEIVIDGENGLLVNPEDEFGLADAMVYLIENEEARDGLGLSGKKIAVEKFQWTGIISQYLEIYAKASGAHVS